MKLNITARHLDLTPALSEYVRKKVEKAQRYFDDIIWVQAVLSVEKLRHIAEIVVHTPGNTFRTKAEAGDLYSAIDLAVHKLDLHLTRIKDKKTTRRGKKNPKEILNERINNFLGDQSEVFPQSFSKEIKEVHKVVLKTLSLKQAVEKLNSNGLSLLPFINDQTHQINIVYKKGNHGVGLLETEEGQ